MNRFETDFNHIFKPLSESEYKEFKQGQQDAKNGVKHQDKSKAYTEGYAEKTEELKACHK